MTRNTTDRNANNNFKRHRLVASLIAAIAILAAGGLTRPALAAQQDEFLADVELEAGPHAWPAFAQTDMDEVELPLASSMSLAATTTFDGQRDQAVLAAPLPPAALSGGIMLGATFAWSMLWTKRRTC